MLSSKIKTSFIWGSINTGGSQVLGFIFSIVLARLLSPEDFGIIAIVVSLNMIANIFVDSGLSQAMIREQNVTNLDYNSVFYFSLLIGLLCSYFLFSSSGFVADFFSEPNMASVIQIMSVSPIIYSLMAINNTIIIKQLNFKLRAKLSLTAVLISGIVSLSLAILGFGIWCLVVMQLLNIVLLMIFLWCTVKWRPSLKFDYKSVLKYLRFGVIISISNLANLFASKSYVLIIGKYFSILDASYFTRADSLKNVPTKMVSKIISKVSYPILSKMQNESKILRRTSVDMVRFTAVISMPIILGMASVADELIVTLIGERWLPAGQIFMYLCFAGILQPLETINMNIIKSNGKISTYLKIELLKIFMVFLVIGSGLGFGMRMMLFSIIVYSILSFIISGHIAGKIINYSFREYCLDISQPVTASLLMFLVVYMVKNYFNLGSFLELLLAIISGFTVMVILYEVMKNREYLIIKKNIYRVRSK